MTRIPFILVFILTVVALMAQDSAGLRGIVTDSSGAVIPAVTVNVTGKGVQKSTQSLADGSYTFSGLSEGDYKVAVTYPGFVAFEHAVTIQPGIAAQFPIQLIPGGSKQELTVAPKTGGPR